MGARGPGAKPACPPQKVPPDPPIRRQQIVTRAEGLINWCYRLKMTSGAQSGRDLILREWQRDIIHALCATNAGGANTICLNMSGNASDVESGEEGYRLRQRPGSTFALQDFTGDGTNAADVTAWVQAVKGNAGSTQIIIGSAFSAAASACQTP